jgi:alpha-amylase
MKTESAVIAPVPTFLASKPDTGVTPLAAPLGTPRDYLTKWHADWVRNYGFDGFRCDTAKNVDVPSWKAVKDAAAPALAEWKSKNPTKKVDDAPFWMTGEVYGHGLAKDEYYTAGGFDSLINFKFQPDIQNLFLVQKTLAAGAAVLDDEYATIAGLVSKDPTFDVLNYLSSHDTRVFYSLFNYDPKIQRQAGTALLLAPGGAQVFYGDESGRQLGPSADDSVQGTRSDMNWTSLDPAIFAHWQKLGTFRRDHAAVGAGAHARIASPAGTYAFSRTLATGDAVVVAITEAQ